MVFCVFLVFLTYKKWLLEIISKYAKFWMNLLKLVKNTKVGTKLNFAPHELLY